MCGGSVPSPPPPAELPEPVPAPPAPEQTAQAPKLQDDVIGAIGSSESEKRRFKAQGTSSLRIPLGIGDDSAQGLNIPV